MEIAWDWQDYELLDAGGGEKLERWGKYILRRPDPQAAWPKNDAADWNRAAAIYHRSSTGGGSWSFPGRLPESWQVGWRELRFRVRPMGFKHTGLFPEQAVNWAFMMDKVAGEREPEVLNLFAYTGGATAALAAAGARVVHVDAAKGIVSTAKENLALSGLSDRPVRFLVDDAKKFVAREIRRGRKYRGIVMDPPTYGRGPSGEVWRIEDELYGLLASCTEILEDPLFVIINGYTTGLSPTVLVNLLKVTIGERFGGRAAADEIGLPLSGRNLVLPCGVTARWTHA